jgi:hypothetical protein
MIDSMIYDRIVAASGMVAALRRLIDARRLDVVVCHVQEDEVAATPDEARRRALTNVPVSKKVRSSVFVLDVSRLGEARLGAPQQGDLDYEILAGPNRRHAQDAVIALTALNEAEVLVTDERRLRSQLADKNLPVWTFAEFHEWVVDFDDTLRQDPA